MFVLATLELGRIAGPLGDAEGGRVLRLRDGGMAPAGCELLPFVAEAREGLARLGVGESLPQRRH